MPTFNEHFYEMVATNPEINNAKIKKLLYCFYKLGKEDLIEDMAYMVTSRFAAELLEMDRDTIL